VLIQAEPGQLGQLRLPIQQLGWGDAPDLRQIRRPYRQQRPRPRQVDRDIAGRIEADAAELAAAGRRAGVGMPR
jgi:hypothetical protein